MSTLWKPHVVVAALVERNGRFLMVEETTEDGVRYNQPAGHLEANESLVDAVVRETLEETAHHFVPEALLGIYRWRAPQQDRVYLRFAFTGHVTRFDPDRALDAGILRAMWLTPAEIDVLKPQHRSLLIAQCIADYQAGRRYPLDLLTHYGDAST
ncbi:MAG: NUDIX hydrolase [Thiobacillus sp.]